MFEPYSQIAKSWSDALEGAARLVMTSLDLSMSGTQSAMSLMSGAGGASTGAIAKTDGMNGGATGATHKAVTERVAARTSTARSWYRAPYRSPFDPLFWMEPTAQVASQRPVWGDVIPGGYQPWGPASFLAMMPTMQWAAAAMPEVGRAPAFPVADRRGVAADVGNAGVAMPWLTGSAWQPMLTMWSEQADCWRSGMLKPVVPGVPAMMAAAAEAADQSFSAYRSAGGHASAQVIVGSARATAAGLSGSQLDQLPGGMMWSSVVDWQRDSAERWMKLWLARG